MITNYNFILRNIKNLQVNDYSNFVNLEKPKIYTKQDYINLAFVRKIDYFTNKTENLILPEVVKHGHIHEVNSIYGFCKLLKTSFTKVSNMRRMLVRNLYLINIKLPKLRKVGNFFLIRCPFLTNANFPNLKIVGNGFLEECEYLEKIELKKLTTAGAYFMERCLDLKSITLSNRFGRIVDFDRPVLAKWLSEAKKELKESFLFECFSLEEIIIPNFRMYELIPTRLLSKIKS